MTTDHIIGVGLLLVVVVGAIWGKRDTGQAVLLALMFLVALFLLGFADSIVWITEPVERMGRAIFGGKG